MIRQEPDPLVKVEAAFEFLVVDFGFARADVRRERGGFELRYSKDAVGILVDWYPRDPLTVWLVKLVNENFPTRGQAVIRADSTLYYFDLGHLEALSGRERTGRRDLYAPSAENARMLARSLRASGESLLSGDARQFDILQDYVKERVRQVTIAHYGKEYARTLGW